MQQDKFEHLLNHLRESIGENKYGPMLGFNSRRWLMNWMDRPQPALGGKKPKEMMKTEEGFRAVAKLLGASVSGAYQ